MKGAVAYAVQSGQLAPEAFEGSSLLPSSMQGSIASRRAKGKS